MGPNTPHSAAAIINGLLPSLSPQEQAFVEHTMALIDKSAGFYQRNLQLESGQKFPIPDRSRTEQVQEYIQAEHRKLLGLLQNLLRAGSEEQSLAG